MIHSDQTGFIMGKETRDNSITMIQLSPYHLLSTDAEKTFDRVD